MPENNPESATAPAALYRSRVQERIRAALLQGHAGLMEVLSLAGGADPRLVAELLEEMGTPRIEAGLSHAGYQTTSDFQLKLPAPNPMLAQWWFTAATVEKLAQLALQEGQGEGPLKVTTIGSTTAGVQLGHLGCDVTVIDIDPDVCAAAEAEVSNLRAVVHDARTPLPECLVGASNVVLADPPWYDLELRSFLALAVEASRAGASILCTLPPLLTRPGVHEERRTLIADLASFGVAVEALDSGAVSYLVPRFEEQAYASLAGFSARPWRRADLLRLRVVDDRKFPRVSVATLPERSVTPFSRRSREFRVFLREGAQRCRSTTLRRDFEYSQTVSRRVGGYCDIDIWTTDKVGALVGEMRVARAVLLSWSQGDTLKRAAERVASLCGSELEDALSVVRLYDDILTLWSRYGEGAPRRTAQEIAGRKRKDLSPWATIESIREHGGQSDGYRREFQRDRDRVLWSAGFRKLSQKTQLFPVPRDANVRQRLAHSLEVMQLATTIGESFGLDESLIEAGALAHDIGHTPFGHAGEYALDALLKQLDVASGFNHYEHGVDVVRFLEGPYSYSSHGYHGLNLTTAVCECIFKHTFCHSGPGASHEQLRKMSKHQKFLSDGHCHVEGQAVRLADKVSYLISDLEDGLMLGVIDEAALLACRLFHRIPINLGVPRGAPLHARFVAQRGRLLKVLMEDAIQETSRRLAKTGSAEAVRVADSYVVAHSREIQSDVDEVWVKLQEGRLHPDVRVMRANARAARIVGELTLLTALYPDTVEPLFRSEHKRLWGGPYMEHYRKGAARVHIPPSYLQFLPIARMIGGGVATPEAYGSRVPIEDLILAKDYVASMTDQEAQNMHAGFLGSGVLGGPQ